VAVAAGLPPAVVTAAASLSPVAAVAAGSPPAVVKVTAAAVVTAVAAAWGWTAVGSEDWVSVVVEGCLAEARAQEVPSSAQQILGTGTQQLRMASKPQGH
jgi:hypothetical protein